ncbi:MAG: Bifunctional protein: zinc-containing alcohol dehydrogenase [Pedosphaera sp.]|nr:Bifunctional protein: zinc-containing alcohol dehydrogenase [Pedosphaera sp.]
MDKDDLTALAAAKRPRLLKKSRKPASRPHVEQKKTLMKAAAIDRFGPPSVLKLHTVPVPEPGPGEVLIALHAAGVGVWDADIRGGWWPEGRPKFPLILGTDGAGTIAAMGSRVRRFRKNDRVWAYEFINPKGGFYAEYVAVNSEHVGRVPPRLDLLQAGAAAVTGLTALQGVADHLRVRPGETVLIYGASGAVGTLAIQFAKSRGARVLGTATGRDAATLVRRLGAAGVIDARSKRGIEELQALAPNGLDAVLAFAGGDGLERCLDLVRAGGRVAHPNGVEPEPKKRRNLKILSYDAVNGRREFDRLASAVEAAKLKVPIAAIYPLAQAAKAHERIMKGHVLGRIALRIR